MKAKIFFQLSLCYLLLMVIPKQGFTQTVEDVGNMAIDVSVDAMGNANAVIPIKCPPGRQNMQPNISVVYNSSSGEGLLGRNMNLTGLSYISRAGRNFHINGVQQGVELDINDQFTLDGNALVHIGGAAHGNAGSRYRTENDQFAQITFKGNHFEVLLKNGGRLFYGLGTSSLVPSGASTPLNYYLWRSYDIHGNYIEYVYAHPGGQIQLVEVKYTGFDPTLNGTRGSVGTSIAPDNKIKFNYKDATSFYKTWVKGASLQHQKILEDILVYEGTSWIWYYMPTYSSNGIHDYLQSFKEVAKGPDKMFPPITFEWEDEGLLNTFKDGRVQTTGFNYGDLSHTATGDFNGDGKSDILVILGVLDPSRGKVLTSNHKFKIHPVNNDGSISGNIICDGNILQGTNQQAQVNNVCNVLVGDLNQDGLDDILFQEIDFLWQSHTIDVIIEYHAMIAQRKNDTINFHVVRNYFATFNQNGLPHSIPHFQDHLHQTPYLGDCDGDGLLDLIEVNKYKLGGNFKLGDVLVTYGLNRTIRNHLNVDFSHNNVSVFHENVADYDGDGRSDITLVFDDRTHIIEPTGGNAKTYILQSVGFPTSFHKGYTYGDFNGDGKTDFLTYNDKWYIHYSTGDGWDTKDATAAGWNIINKSPFSGETMNYQNNNDQTERFSEYWKPHFRLIVGDYNGDGKDDLFELNWNGGNSNSFKAIYYSNGLGFIKENLGIVSSQARYINYGYSIVADFDGNGKSDVLSRHYPELTSHTNNLYIGIDYFKSYHKRLRTINVSPLKKHILTLKPAPQSGHVLFTTRVLYDQAVAIAAKIWVVEQHEYKVLNTNVNPQSQYYYSTLLMHRHGRGVMGFLKTATVNNINDPNNNTTTISYNEQSAERPYILEARKTEVYKKSVYNFPARFVIGNTLLSSTDIRHFYMNTTANNSRIYFSYPNIITEINYVDHIKKYICNEYDENGNHHFSRAVYYTVDNHNNMEHMSTTHNEFQKFASWIPSEVTKTQTTLLRYENGAIMNPYITEAHFEYHSGRNYLLQAINYVNTNRQTINSYSYDTYGNVTQKRLDYAGNPTGNPITTANYTYTANGRFLATKTNPANQVSSYTFDFKTGNIKIETSPTGQPINYMYDIWGKYKGEYNGTTSYYTNYYLTANASVPLPPFVSTIIPYYQIEKVPKKLDIVTSYFDNEDRKIAEKYLAYDGSEVWKDWVFNEKSQVIKESNNYKDASSKRYTEYEYDDYGRVVKTTYSGVEMMTTSYNRTAVTTTTKIEGRNVVKKTTTYATGHTAKVEDPGGIITYQLGSHNLPISISTNNATTTIQYDIALNKTQLCEPNAGCINYEYNALGQLTKQIDAKSNTYQMTYDVLGRLVSKTGGANEEYLYTYYDVTGQASVNQLKKEGLKVNGSTKHIIEYEYNAAGLLSSSAEEASGIYGLYTTSYNYDGSQRLTSVHYPNLKLNYHYGAASIMTGIELVERDGDPTSVMLFEKQGELTDGRLTQFEYGNGQRTNFEYDFYYQLTGMRSQHNTNHGHQFNATNMEYEFELTNSNLTMRRNALNSFEHESFNYDNSDRLISIRQHMMPINVVPPLEFNHMETSPEYKYRIAYAPNGNIIGKYDAGSYTYGSKPNAVTSTTHPGYAESITPRILPPHHQEDQSLTYTPFNRVQHIHQANAINGADYGYSPIDVKFEYGVDEQRIKMEVFENGNLTISTSYIGTASMEIVNGQEITYLYAEGMPIAMYNKATDAIHYFHTDYQQSLLAISDENGLVVERRSYDAWGRPRRADNLEYNLPNPFGGSNSAFTLRGYTFHEHLEMVGLINMNARLYDPILGRVLSPDNYAQDPSNTQSFNRYSYCWNNPTKYIDPDGNFITWSLSRSGASIGFNFTPTGVPLGLGFNFGWSNGFSTGIYGEVGYRYGGTGFGSGATASQDISYNFKHNTWSTTTSVGAYGSFGAFNGGASYSRTFDITNKKVYHSWNVSAGVGIGNGRSGLGLNVGYGSGGFNYGMGGYHNPYAKKTPSNPSANSKPEETQTKSRNGADDGGYVTSGDYEAEFPSGNKYDSKGNLIKTNPSNLSEQLTLQEAKSGRGSPIMKGKINDPNFQGWEKMQHVHVNPDGTRTVVHYWRNPTTGEVKFFKFK